MNNPRWEQCLIGTVIGYPADAASVTDVRPQDFAYVTHQNLWAVILDLERRGALSYQAIVEKLRSLGQLNTLGRDVEGGDVTGELYIQDLMSLRAQASIQEFAKSVVDASIKRELRNLAHLTALDAESDQEADSLLDHVEGQIYQLRRNRVETGMDIGQILDRFSDRVDQWRAGNIKPAFTFKTPGLSRIIPFLEATDFMLIAGRPGEGKSSVLRAEAFEAALAGKKVVIFNMENDPIEYANYLVAYHSGIDTRKLRKPDELTEEEVARVKDAARELKRLTSSNLKIVSLGSPTVYEITRIARKLVTGEGYEVVFVDYIQLIKNGIDNEVQDISMSSSMLRGFALKYNVPVIAAAQLNRDQTKRAVGTRPQLSDLRGSGSLEQDAVIVAFVALESMTDMEIRHFEQNRDPDGQYTVRVVYVRLYVEKNRNGPVDRTARIVWQKHLNRYTAEQRQPAQQPSRPVRATQRELPA